MSDYTMTNQEFICAAGSYFGLPGEQLMHGSKLETTEDGTLEIALRLALTPEDMIGIGKRMEAMREMQPEPIDPVKEAQMAQNNSAKIPSNEELRRMYNRLGPALKSMYGSFDRYKRECELDVEEGKEIVRPKPEGAPLREDTEGVGARKVSHIDAPEEEEPTKMDSVWLKGLLTTDAQRLHASDAKVEDGESFYLVQWAMLTEEQRQKAKETGK